MPMLDGEFTYCLGIQSRGGVLYDWREQAGTFEVMNPGKTTGSIFVPAEATLLAAEIPAGAELLPQQAS